MQSHIKVMENELASISNMNMNQLAASISLTPSPGRDKYRNQVKDRENENDIDKSRDRSSSLSVDSVDTVSSSSSDDLEMGSVKDKRLSGSKDFDDEDEIDETDVIANQSANQAELTTNSNQPQMQDVWSRMQRNLTTSASLKLKDIDTKRENVKPFLT